MYVCHVDITGEDTLEEEQQLHEQDQTLVHETFPSDIIEEYIPPGHPEEQKKEKQREKKGKHKGHNNIHPTTPEQNLTTITSPSSDITPQRPDYCNHLQCWAILEPFVQSECGIPADDPYVTACQQQQGQYPSSTAPSSQLPPPPLIPRPSLILIFLLVDS
jgi:hypothetical protein